MKKARVDISIEETQVLNYGESAWDSFVTFVFGCCFSIITMAFLYDFFIYNYVDNLLQHVELSKDDYWVLTLNIDNKFILYDIFLIIFLLQNTIFISILIFYFTIKNMLYINELIRFFRFYIYFTLFINGLFMTYIALMFLFIDPEFTLPKVGFDVNYANQIINTTETLRQLQETIGMSLAYIILDKALTTSVIFIFYMNYQILRINCYLYIFIFLHCSLLVYNLYLLDKAQHSIPYKQIWFTDYVHITYKDKVLKAGKKEINLYPYGYLMFTYNNQDYKIKVIFCPKKE